MFTQSAPRKLLPPIGLHPPTRMFPDVPLDFTKLQAENQLLRSMLDTQIKITTQYMDLAYKRNLHISALSQQLSEATTVLLSDSESEGDADDVDERKSNTSPTPSHASQSSQSQFKPIMLSNHLKRAREPEPPVVVASELTGPNALEELLAQQIVQLQPLKRKVGHSNPADVRSVISKTNIALPPNEPITQFFLHPSATSSMSAFASIFERLGGNQQYRNITTSVTTATPDGNLTDDQRLQVTSAVASMMDLEHRPHCLLTKSFPYTYTNRTGESTTHEISLMYLASHDYKYIAGFAVSTDVCKFMLGGNSQNAARMLQYAQAGVDYFKYDHVKLCKQFSTHTFRDIIANMMSYAGVSNLHKYKLHMSAEQRQYVCFAQSFLCPYLHIYERL